ncbi:MAG TPA: hypothetical protein VFB58_10905 [Chloroflexota bacterium]|nr:hypothetical protein [Chloroflexota bacterium]
MMLAPDTEIIIGRAGRPVARLVPYHRPRRTRQPGIWAGRVHLVPDFDELPEDLQRAFDGESA